MKTYFANESADYSGIPSDILETFDEMVNSTSDFVTSSFISSTKISNMLDRYLKMLIFALHIKDEFDKEVIFTMDSYETTMALTNTLKDAAIQRIPVSCIINFDKHLFEATKTFL